MWHKKTLRLVLTMVLGSLAFLAGSPLVTAADPNGFINPTPGEAISGVIRITGTAHDPYFAAYQLDLLPRGGDQPVFFVDRGTGAVEEPGRLGRMDSALYPDGDYRLRLRVIRQDGNYDDYFTSITIANGPLGGNGIREPLPGARVACLVTVRGIAYSNSYRKQQIDFLPWGIEYRAILLQRGTAPRNSEGRMAQFDSTQFPDGDHALRLRVVHEDGNYDTFYSPVSVDNREMATALQQRTCSCVVPVENAQPAGENGFSNPTVGSSVSGTVPVCGIAADPAFSAWQLDLAFDGDLNNTVMIAYSDTANTTRAPFTLLDTTLLPDGKHLLRLRVARIDSTFDEHTTPLCVANHQLISAAGACP